MLKAIYTYPIKSMGGISLKEAEMGPRGIKYDRRWILTDPNGKMLTQRSHPIMALFKTRLRQEGVVVTAPHKPNETKLLPYNSYQEESSSIQVWDTAGRGYALGPDYDAWFSKHMDFPCRIWYMPEDSDRKLESSYTSYQGPMSFADGWPLLVVSESSLVSLNEQLAEPVPMNRFRPNLVVEGQFPFQEDSWSRIRIGGAIVEGGKPCGRCTVITVDQETGEKGKEPLRTLASWRLQNSKAVFGWNMFSREGGLISVGDEVIEL